MSDEILMLDAEYAITSGTFKEIERLLVFAFKTLHYRSVVVTSTCAAFSATNLISVFNKRPLNTFLRNARYSSFVCNNITNRN